MQGALPKRTTLAVTFLVVWSAAAVLGLTWGIRYDFPDNVHLRHGLPVSWGIHTLATITGPVDLWFVDLSFLLIDLVFWLGVMVVVVTTLWPRAPVTR